MVKQEDTHRHLDKHQPNGASSEWGNLLWHYQAYRMLLLQSASKRSPVPALKHKLGAVIMTKACKVHPGEQDKSKREAKHLLTTASGQNLYLNIEQMT